LFSFEEKQFQGLLGLDGGMLDADAVEILRNLVLCGVLATIEGC